LKQDKVITSHQMSEAITDSPRTVGVSDLRSNMPKDAFKEMECRAP